MEVQFKSTRYIPMFTIFVVDCQMYQKTGFAGDWDIADAIDWDDEADVVALDFTTWESNDVY